MSTPGLGSIVIYHWNYSGSDVIDVPAIVLATHDTWQSTWSGQYPTQPDTDQVLLQSLGPGPTNQLATEGTSPGEFSRISLALDLGTIDLGSVDLSNTTATNVSVPDV